MFLLSQQEFSKYVEKSIEAEAKLRYVMEEDDEISGNLIMEFESSLWWLRTPGTTKLMVKYVDYDGKVYEADSNFHIGIRPAIWIKC